MACRVTTDFVRDRGWLHITKGGNINTTQRDVIIIHTYRQQDVIRYTHTLDQTQSCYTIHTGVYTGC